MDKVVVSFCIATYQRYEALKELIEEILSVKSNKIEVVVCDDRSQDGSIKKIKMIEDSRLKVYVNNENVGSLLNIHDSLDKGNGKYLFYINDRDNVDSFKIDKLIDILECFEIEDVAFAKCIESQSGTDKYRIFQEGKEALEKFSCKIDHPTGYIFKKEYWNKIHKKRKLFSDQKYGDYVFTQICAILAQKHKGALIYGDICDVSRRRIDFSNVKSGYYKKRTDKRLWYTPGVIFRELRIGQIFLKKLRVQENIKHQIFLDRYQYQLKFCVTEYERIIKDCAYTAHYDFYPSQNSGYIFIKSIMNGIYLWRDVTRYCFANDMYLYDAINRITKKEFCELIKRKYDNGNEKGEIYKREIYKREVILDTFERWIKAELEGKRISNYLIEKGYKKVAIYGLGRLGRHLYKELSDSQVQVCYVIDQNPGNCKQYVENTPYYYIDSELPCVDIIIVTVSGDDTKKIIMKLKEKGKFKVKSMNDILFVI